jgi:hypothetical protein
MYDSSAFRAALAVVVATLGLATGGPVAATSAATPTASANGKACTAVLRGLNPAERHYVVAMASLTYTQLAAAFGTKEVNASIRPMDSCNLTRTLK